MQHEFLSWDEQQRFQVQQLNKVKSYLIQHNAYYRDVWTKCGVLQKEIKDLKDLSRYPTCSKEVVQQHYENFVCAPHHQIREFCATSGTLGQPLSVPLTGADLERLAYNEYLSFQKLELTEDDTVLLMLTLDRMFMAGMAYYLGLQKIGSKVIRSGAGMPQMQWDAIFRYQPSTLVGVPSFILKMIQYAQEHNIPYRESSVKKILCIGESLKDEALNLNQLAIQISSQWNVSLFNTYASTEMQTGFTECRVQSGGHLHSDLIAVEILDDNDNIVPSGMAGEVCITTLGIEGMPLWRYKTGDIAKLYYDPCPCGRNTPRMSGIVGRKNHMIKLNGTTLFPNTIFEALHQCVNANDYFVELNWNNYHQDTITIYLDSKYEGTLENKSKIIEFLRAKLRIVPHIVFITTHELKKIQFPEISRKQIKFADKRKQ
jgi:phenylacetate-CoA ligase